MVRRMDRRTSYRGLLFAVVGYCLLAQATTVDAARPEPAQQNTEVSGKTSFDPLKQLTSGFPDSIHLKNNGRLLEFCPDKDACDGFITSGVVPLSTLKDFAYLYIYFYSGYYALPEWRHRDDAKKAVETVLSKPEYGKCRGNGSLEAARCVLLDLSRDGKIKLLFVRYGEGRRNVVPEDIVKELSAAEPAPTQ